MSKPAFNMNGEWRVLKTKQANLPVLRRDMPLVQARSGWMLLAPLQALVVWILSSMVSSFFRYLYPWWIPLPISVHALTRFLVKLARSMLAWIRARAKRRPPRDQ